MNLNLKLTTKKSPSLDSLRPKLFDAEKTWLTILFISAILFVVAGYVGYKLFIIQYYEDYKKETNENFENIINTKRLESAVENRVNFINSTTTVSEDPSA
jgi:hypothetical protein